MPRACIGMHLMAVEAGDFFVAIKNNVTHVPKHVTVPRVQLRIVGSGEVDREILKEIVARNKVVRIGKPNRS